MTATITNEQFLSKLDEYSPQWVTEYADHRDLVEFARGQITADRLRNRTAVKLWPIANAMWVCVAQAQAPHDDYDYEED